MGFNRSSVDELQCNYRAQPQLETGAATAPHPHPLAEPPIVPPPVE